MEIRPGPQYRLISLESGAARQSTPDHIISVRLVVAYVTLLVAGDREIGPVLPVGVMLGRACSIDRETAEMAIHSNLPCSGTNRASTARSGILRRASNLAISAAAPLATWWIAKVT